MRQPSGSGKNQEHEPRRQQQLEPEGRRQEAGGIAPSASDLPNEERVRPETRDDAANDHDRSHEGKLTEAGGAQSSGHDDGERDRHQLTGDAPAREPHRVPNQCPGRTRARGTHGTPASFRATIKGNRAASRRPKSRVFHRRIANRTPWRG